MTTRRTPAVTLFLLCCLPVFLVLPGCQRKEPMTDRANMAAAPASEPISGPRFLRQSERDYYVDQYGALHTITRREGMTGGGIYYIEGDERPYMLEPSGRLYYREPEGRVIYLEEVNPGGSAHMMAGSPQYMHPGGSAHMMEGAPSHMYPAGTGMHWQSCESQWQNCLEGCETISPRQRYDRPNCIRNCEAIRAGCTGR